MELLQYQSMVHSESRPTGRLRDRQDCVTSLSSSDFMLAASVVCMDLYHGLQLQTAGRPSGDTYTWGRERRDEMLAALRRSKEIWDELRDETLEAWKASTTLGVMLGKLDMGFRGVESNNANANPTFEPQDEKQNAAMTLGLLSSGMNTSNTGPSTFSDQAFKTEAPLTQGGTGMATDVPGAPSPFGSTFGQMPDMPLNLDWVSPTQITQPHEQLANRVPGDLGFVYPKPHDGLLEPAVADDGHITNVTTDSNLRFQCPAWSRWGSLDGPIPGTVFAASHWLR